MAKVSNPLNSGEARGSIGTLTYNTWRGMATVKTKASPPYNSAGLQGNMFRRVRDAAQRWKILTDAQRASWEVFANTHLLQNWSTTTKRISGFNWYVKIQTRRQILSQGYEDNPPTREITWGFSSLSAVVSNDSEYISWTPNVGSLQSYMLVEIWLTPIHSAGRKATLRDARIYGHYLLSSGIFAYAPPENGTYSAFIRCIDLNGMVAPFQSITYLFVAEEGLIGGGGDE